MAIDEVEGVDALETANKKLTLQKMEKEREKEWEGNNVHKQTYVQKKEIKKKNAKRAQLHQRTRPKPIALVSDESNAIE